MLQEHGPLFTKQTDAVPLDFVKSRSRKIEGYNCIVSTFGGHLSNIAVEVPVKFRDDWIGQNQSLAASRLHEILR